MSSKIKQLRLELEAERTRQLQALLAGHPRARHRFEDRWYDTQFFGLHKRSRALLDPRSEPYLHALHGLRKKHWVRTPKTWRPKGRAWLPITRSLFRHLLCEYPIGAVWDCVWDQPNVDGRECYLALAKGRSLVHLVKDAWLTVPLTRRECHLLNTMSRARTLAAAVRLAQVRARGGERSFGREFAASLMGDALCSSGRESMRVRVMKWTLRQRVPLAEVRRIVHASELAPRWFMRVEAGGARAALRELPQLERIVGVAPSRATRRAPAHSSPESRRVAQRWAPSRFTGLHENNMRVLELTSAQALFDEGRSLHHCVAGYTEAAAAGRCSLWSVRVSGTRVLTVEVKPDKGEVVQIRGIANQDPSAAQMQLVRRWAELNGLRFASHLRR